VVKQCVVSGTIGVTLDVRRINQGGSDPSTQFMVLLVWYMVFCVISHHFTSSSVVGAVWVKMDRLPPESQEQLNLLGGITLLRNSVPKAVEVSSRLRRLRGLSVVALRCPRS